MADNVIDEALVALDGGELALVERVTDAGGRAFDRVALVAAPVDDIELAAILAL